MADFAGRRRLGSAVKGSRHRWGTYSRLCRLWFTLRASAKAMEPLSPTELLESLRHKRRFGTASKGFTSPRLFLLQQ